MNVLHARLIGSLHTTPDVIDFAGSLDEEAVCLRDASRSVGFAAAAGALPSEATLRQVESIASRLLRSVEVFRLAGRL